MVTKHSVMVQSGRGIQYKFETHRKYTIIRGDSATGKTTLVNMVEDATVRKTASISCDVPCAVLPELNWELNLAALKNHIVFIDEDHPALAEGKKLGSLLRSAENCFVIISRDRMSWLPYSYKEIYQIKTSGKYHFLERIYEDMEEFIENKQYVIEDEASGLQYFQKWYGDCVRTSFGNSNLSKYADPEVTLIGDGAAIGPYMYDLMLGKSDLFLPESFEWLLLHSPIFENDKYVKAVLQNPENYIETNYQSWEEFFTDFIMQLTMGKEYQYSKRKLNPCYTARCCFKSGYCEGFSAQNKNVIKVFYEKDTR